MTSSTTLDPASAEVTSLEDALFVLRGSYAARVADRIGVPAERRVVVHRQLYPAEIPWAPVLVAVGAGRDRAFRDRLDATAFLRGIPSVGLELLPTQLVCGPAVRPGRTACYVCYTRRLDQHGVAHPATDAATMDLPEGYGPEHVAIGVGLLRDAVDEVTGDRDVTGGIGGTVRTLDLVTGALSVAPTTAVNLCGRCGGRYADQRTGLGAVAGLA